jgi:hypothetical protein
MKNIKQKVPPIFVVKVAFILGELPINETETYLPTLWGPQITQWGQGCCEIAIS